MIGIGLCLLLLGRAILEKRCSRNANDLYMRRLKKYPVSGLWVMFPCKKRIMGHVLMIGIG